MQQYIFLDKELWFPPHDYADKDGLLAIGGDLSIERLILAYQNGIFPWYSDGEPLLWWSPNPRFVLYLDKFHLTRKQQKIIQQSNFIITENCCFSEVIKFCAKVPRKKQQDCHATWITHAIQEAYLKLHQHNICHSIEVWHTQKPNNSEQYAAVHYDNTKYYLVGGLYGVLTPHVFCGESMFSLMPEASRAALQYLVEKLKKAGHILIDCQTESPHFIRMGAEHISRTEFLTLLK